MKPGDTLPSVEREITRERIGRYAEASGDFNPLHVDDVFAAESQFGRTIAHGMMIASTVSEIMSSAFGMDWFEAGRLKLRFRAPVFPGESIIAYGSVKTVREGEGAKEIVCSVGVRKRNGEDAVTGEASVRLRQ